MTKLVAYVKVVYPPVDGWMKWAADQKSTVTDEDIDLQYGDKADKIREFSDKLFSTLVSSTEDDAFRICLSLGKEWKWA